MMTMLVVPLRRNGGRLNATSRPRPTDTDGTALGTKKNRSRKRRATGRTERIAMAAQVPMTRAAALAAIPVKTLARSWSAEDPSNAAA